MPMTKKRRRVDKKKRRNLFTTVNIAKVDKPIEKSPSPEQSQIKKTKNGRVDQNLEDSVEESSVVEDLKQNRSSFTEVLEKELNEQSVEESCDDIETDKEMPKLKKTKQRYENAHNNIIKLYISIRLRNLVLKKLQKSFKIFTKKKYQICT